jgi:hypothetical protein
MKDPRTSRYVSRGSFIWNILAICDSGDSSYILSVGLFSVRSVFSVVKSSYHRGHGEHRTAQPRSAQYMVNSISRLFPNLSGRTNSRYWRDCHEN